VQSDVIIVPDGTPLTLRLEQDVSSANAKVGDTVTLTVPYPARLNGLVFVPKGTPVSAAVVKVTPAHRPSRDGEVVIKIGDLTLPTGETVTLRQALKPQSAAGKAGDDVSKVAPLVVNPIAGIGYLESVWFFKGDEKVFRAGSWTKAYINGPLELKRDALTRLQPPPYKGAAQVFFKNRKGPAVNLYVGDEYIAGLFEPVWLKLKPGTYSFHTIKAKEDALQFEVQEDHQYWIERENGRLAVKNTEEHRDEIEELAEATWLPHKDFSAPTPTYSGPPQIYFGYRGNGGKLFCGRKNLGESFGYPLRIEVKPGTYSFSIGKPDKHPIRVAARENEQYWMERRPEGLFLSDYQHLHDEFERPKTEILDLNFTLPSMKQNCLPESAGSPEGTEAK
jgi:hypothetical protein